MDIKVIKNQTDYELALKQLGALMDRDPLPESKDENVLELLLIVIRDYEQKIVEPITVDPIEAIKFRMDQMELLRQDLVPYMGSISRVSEILTGKRALSLSMIRKLHEGLGIPLESLVVQYKRRPIHKKQIKTKRKKLFIKKRKKFV